jgi:hypothetical protein
MCASSARSSGDQRRFSARRVSRYRSTVLPPASTAFVLGGGVTLELERVRLRTFLQTAERSDSRLVGAAAEFRF